MAARKTIRVLDLRDSPWVDGPGRTILDCAVSLQNDGRFQFIIGTFSGGIAKSNVYADEAKKRGLGVVVIKESSAFDWRVLRQVQSFISANNIDIVHTHDLRSNFFGLLGARMSGKPVVTTVHGWIANDNKGKAFVFADKFLLRFFDYIVAVSQRTANLLEKALIRPKKINVIHNALKIDTYRLNRGDNRFRKEIGVSPETTLIANIGRLSPEKGQLEFLQAGKLILRKYPTVRLVLIGIGPDQDKLRSFVDENQMGSAVTFAGFRKDMVCTYNSIDLVVQSSFTEGMPNVVLESLLMEVPVIATDVGGTAEIVTDGVTGILIKPRDIPELARKVESFLEEPERFRNMAKRGRTTIQNNFDHSTRAQKLAHVYSSMLNV